MSEPKLKPCPFCGEHIFHITDTEDGDLAMRCDSCGAYGPWADNTAGAEEQWNRRAK